MTDEPPESAPPAPEPAPESAPAPTPDSEPILPPAISDAELKDAVGAPQPRRAETPLPIAEDDESLDLKRNRRTIAFALAFVVAGLVAVALVFLGRANAGRYVIACSRDHVTAEEGRAFPPWGTKPLTGPEWKPIALAANAECKPRETEDEAEIERWYLEILVDRASTALAAHDLLDTIPGDPAHATANPLDAIAGELDQALLLARAPERRDQRKEIERLIGDVHYWRAAARVRDATATLLDAAKQFDAAAAERPRHEADAAGWASFLRKLGDELHAGPGGEPATGSTAPTMAPSPEHPAAPPGVALPVEPAPNADVTPPAEPDAGIPSGGVLL